MGLAADALDHVDAFVDLPGETRARLASLAKVEVLLPDDEVASFGAALLVEGSASVCATIVDEPVSSAVPGTLLPTRGSLADAVALRVVAGAQGARVAVWAQSVVEEALRACPWVLEELVARADRLQALAGATMGPLGELDEATRNQVVERLLVVVATPREPIKADPAALALVCAGSVELAGDAPTLVRAGEVLFPRAGAAAAAAGAQGAILLVGERRVLEELAPTIAATLG